MEHLKSKNGITMISLTITTIVLLILGGITLMIANDLIIDKAVMASNKTVEVALKEKIEMAWMEVKTLEVSNKINFKEELAKSLTETYHFENVKVSESAASSIRVSFIHQNQEYNFIVLPNGEIKLDVGSADLLKGTVTIGDYIEYPIEYTDVYSNEKYVSTNGWRVLDDGIMEGTTGCVRIISTGVPVKWNYVSMEYSNNEVVEDQLINHFEDLTLLIDVINGDKVKGSYFKDSKFADRVSTLTLSDLNQVYNNLYRTNRRLDDISMIEDSKYHLFNLKGYSMFYYWLATMKEGETGKMYYMSETGMGDETRARLGIRPVIYLKDGLNGELEKNVWKIID